ncbi:hypothetical protein [Flexibacterium corallicola]|uniref:hypothetical protein n=1 Tax=Flexibacterium corallicola TaxID=3037259 RepID=UPI00286F20BA|nr:hypothetical protein [Pseudovibrio sp. M1P-2-3]
MFFLGKGCEIDRAGFAVPHADKETNHTVIVEYVMIAGMLSAAILASLAAIGSSRHLQDFNNLPVAPILLEVS